MEVNSFWSDGDLTPLEQLCLSSFMRNGHVFNLYVYDETGGVPDGVAVRDASEILPRERLFRYANGEFNLGSVSGFSNLFRYSVIHQKGGWWVDTDVCLLQDFDDASEEIFFLPPTVPGEAPIASSIFKAPAGSPVLARCLEMFATKDVMKIVHGETGPTMISEAVTHAGHEHFIQPGDSIFPVPWWETERLFREDFDMTGWRAVHFWNAMISHVRLDKRWHYPDTCVFERLKRAYL